MANHCNRGVCNDESGCLCPCEPCNPGDLRDADAITIDPFAERATLRAEVAHWKDKAGAYGSMAYDANVTLGGVGKPEIERLRDAAIRVVAERDEARAEVARLQSERDAAVTEALCAGDLRKLLDAAGIEVRMMRREREKLINSTRKDAADLHKACERYKRANVALRADLADHGHALAVGATERDEACRTRDRACLIGSEMIERAEHRHWISGGWKRLAKLLRADEIRAVVDRGGTRERVVMSRAAQAIDRLRACHLAGHACLRETHRAKGEVAAERDAVIRAARSLIAIIDRDGGHAQEGESLEQSVARASAKASLALVGVVDAARRMLAGAMRLTTGGVGVLDGPPVFAVDGDAHRALRAALTEYDAKGGE